MNEVIIDNNLRESVTCLCTQSWWCCSSISVSIHAHVHAVKCTTTAIQLMHWFTSQSSSELFPPLILLSFLRIWFAQREFRYLHGLFVNTILMWVRGNLINIKYLILCNSFETKNAFMFGFNWCLNHRNTFECQMEKYVCLLDAKFNFYTQDSRERNTKNAVVC